MNKMIISYLFKVLIAFCLSFTSIALSLKLHAITNYKLLNKKTNLAGVGSANLDWQNLGFQYRETDYFVYARFSNGAWSELMTSDNPYIPIHIGATALHYGQSCFEGLKAFQCKDGKIRVFRPDENAKRISNSAERICMPGISELMFLEAVKNLVNLNKKYIPPYGTGGAMYLRPLLFGSGPRIGLMPSEEYIFLMLAVPVADYYKGGLHPVKSVVAENFDRAAPRGVGNVKVGGNYAADLLPNMAAKKAGYPISLYLDAKTNSFVEEFSTSNFFAIDKDNNFVTPDSSAILKSITNKSLLQLASSEGLKTQVRKIHIDEVMNGGFKEAAACGTAVVITPISSLSFKSQIAHFGSESDPVGPNLRMLYKKVREIQNGESEDKFGWMYEV